MTTPPQPQPSPSGGRASQDVHGSTTPVGYGGVGLGGQQGVAQQFDVMLHNLRAVNQELNRLNQQVSVQIQASTHSVGGGTAGVHGEASRMANRALAARDLNNGATRISDLDALRSKQGLQRWAFQRMGEVIAGGRANVDYASDDTPRAGAHRPGAGAPPPAPTASPREHRAQPQGNTTPEPPIPPIPGALGRGSVRMPTGIGGPLQMDDYFFPPRATPIDLTAWGGTPPPAGGAGGGGGGGGEPPLGGEGFQDEPGGGAPGGGGSGGSHRAPRATVASLRGSLGNAVATSGGIHGLAARVRNLPGANLIESGLNAPANLYAKRWYQGQVGGSVLGTEVPEQLHERAYGMSMRFTPFGEANARQSFRDVTAMGYNGMSPAGRGRQDALNFMYHQFTTRGMAPAESQQYLQVASRDPQQNLNNLSNAIKNLSDTAREAGVNAMQARTQFLQTFQTFQQQGFGGAAATSAAALQSNLTGMGRTMQGVSAASFGSTQMRYILGAQSGMSPGQELAMQRTSPQGFANQVTQYGTRMWQSYLTPEQTQWIQNQVKQIGGGQALQTQPDFANTIANNFIQQFQNSFDFDAYTGFLNSTLGMNFNIDQAMVWTVNQVGGNTPAQQAASQAQSSAKVDVKTGTIVGPDGKPTNQKPNAQPGRVSGSTHEGGGVLGTGIGGGGGLFGSGLFKGQQNKAAQAYNNQVKQTGQKDPVLAGLIGNISDPNSKGTVMVHAKGGDRVVSFADAVKLFPNEVASGNVTFVGGQEAGKTVQEISGLAPRTDAATKAAAAKEEANSKNSGVGQSAKDWTAAQAKKGDNRVTIDWANPQIGSILSAVVNPTGAAAATGSPPYSDPTVGSPVGR